MSTRYVFYRYNTKYLRGIETSTFSVKRSMFSFPKAVVNYNISDKGNYIMMPGSSYKMITTEDTQYSGPLLSMYPFVVGDTDCKYMLGIKNENDKIGYYLRWAIYGDEIRCYRTQTSGVITPEQVSFILYQETAEWPDYNSTKTIIASSDKNAYPSGMSNGYAYSYAGSDNIDPTSIAYSNTTPMQGDSITISVTARSNTYGGTISYQYEYSINDGGTWVKEGSPTSSKSKTITIPSNATKFKARVRASDNYGFTSTDYVVGSSLTVTSKQTTTNPDPGTTTPTNPGTGTTNPGTTSPSTGNTGNNNTTTTKSNTKAMYAGINGKARKMRKGYVGVNGVARRIKKGYVGVNGVARLFYASGMDFTWNQGVSPFPRRPIVFGNGKFVAMIDTRSASSTDGIIWNVSTSFPVINQNYNIYTYGNGMFVALPYRGYRIVYSTDGINWALTEIGSLWGSGVEPASLVYGNGKFVGFAYNIGYVGNIYSTNGVTWSNANADFPGGVGGQISHSIYGNGKFVVLLQDGDILYSNNGINGWTRVVTNAPYSSTSYTYWVKLAYGNGKFVAIRVDGYTMHSTDGITWTIGTKLTSKYTGDVRGFKVYFCKDIFIAVSEKSEIFYSIDGVSWELSETPVDKTIKDSWYMAYGNGRIVAIATSALDSQCRYAIY